MVISLILTTSQCELATFQNLNNFMGPVVTTVDSTVREIKKPNSESGSFCKTLVSSCKQVLDVNKRDCSRLNHIKRTKQSSEVFGSGLDPALNDPDMKDFQTKSGKFEYSLSIGLY